MFYSLYRVWERLIAYYTRISFQYKCLDLIFSVTLLIVLLVLHYKKYISRRQVLGYEILGVWLCLVFGVTVFGRESMVDSEVNLSIINVVIERLKYNIDTRLELLFNLFMLFPMGVAQNLINKNSIHLCRYLIMGGAISTVIEVLQLILHKGTFELVDIVGNSMGYVLGLLVAVWIESKINKDENE